MINKWPILILNIVKNIRNWRNAALRILCSNLQRNREAGHQRCHRRRCSTSEMWMMSFDRLYTIIVIITSFKMTTVLHFSRMTTWKWYQTIWLSVNGDRHINKVKLRQARLVLELVTSGTLPSRYLSRPLEPTQPGRPSVGKCVGWQWFWPTLGKKRRVLHSSKPQLLAHRLIVC